MVQPALLTVMLVVQRVVLENVTSVMVGLVSHRKATVQVSSVHFLESKLRSFGLLDESMHIYLLISKYFPSAPHASTWHALLMWGISNYLKRLTFYLKTFFIYKLKVTILLFLSYSYSCFQSSRPIRLWNLELHVHLSLPTG